MELDEPFCVHSKITLDALLQELLVQVSRSSVENRRGTEGRFLGQTDSVSHLLRSRDFCC